MQNLHTLSKLISEDEFRKIEDLLSRAWCKETTFIDIQDEWSSDNKAYGQCAVTTLVINDLFGGKIAYDKPNFHLWNELPDGTWQDFSREQFKDNRDFTVTKYQTKEEIFSNKTGLRNKTEDKYKLLKKRFMELYSK